MMGRLIGTAHIICLYIDQVTFTPEKRVGGGISKRMAIGFAFAFWGVFFNKHLYSRVQKNRNDFEIIFKTFYK